MTDPSMEQVREAFQRQSVACRSLGSDFTAVLCELLGTRLDETTAFGRRVLHWPGKAFADALALRAAAGFHALARSGQDAVLRAVYPPNASDPETLWLALAEAMENHGSFLLPYLDSPPQTNEVRRCGALLGGCLTIAGETGLPLSILEIGSSAGLNLSLDRYFYRLGAMSWGDPNATVKLECDWQGHSPPLDAPLVIDERRGCDIKPLDPARPADRERLLSYIWADQTQRLSVTAAALAAAAEARWPLDRSDAADWIEARLAESPAKGQVRVVAHTIVWQYLTDATRARIMAAIGSAGERASPESPLAWLRMEPDGGEEGAGVSLTLWPGGRERFLGRADFHGRWAKWL